jgi:hypothetical protein
MTDPVTPALSSREEFERQERVRLEASIDKKVPSCPLCGYGLIKVAGFGATHACIRPRAEGSNHFIVATSDLAVEWDKTSDHDKRVLAG